MTEPKRQNRYNRTAGDKWRNQCIDYLRDFGWTGAGPVLEKFRGDILGIGDVTIECTLEDWQHIWEKMRQATRDAVNNGHDVWGVWKKRNGMTDPGQAGVLVFGEVWARVLWRLQKLEHAELEAAEAYDRGYRNGQAAALAVERAGFRHEAVKEAALEALETAARMKEGR